MTASPERIFFPNQFYDYHWPIVLAGRNTVNTGATDPRAGVPMAAAASPTFPATGTRP